MSTYLYGAFDCIIGYSPSPEKNTTNKNNVLRFLSKPSNSLGADQSSRSDTYSEPCQTYKVESFEKRVKGNQSHHKVKRI